MQVREKQPFPVPARPPPRPSVCSLTNQVEPAFDVRPSHIPGIPFTRPVACLPYLFNHFLSIRASPQFVPTFSEVLYFARCVCGVWARQSPPGRGPACSVAPFPPTHHQARHVWPCILVRRRLIHRRLIMALVSPPTVLRDPSGNSLGAVSRSRVHPTETRPVFLLHRDPQLRSLRHSVTTLCCA